MIRIPSLNNQYFVEKIQGRPSSLDRGSSQVLFEPYDPSRFMGTQPSSACDQRHPHGQSTDAWQGKKTHSQGWQSLQCEPDKRPVIFGRMKFNSTQNGWNNPSYKFRQIQIVCSTIFRGLYNPHGGNQTASSSLEFSQTFAPKSLGNVTIFQSRMTLSGDLKTRC